MLYQRIGLLKQSKYGNLLVYTIRKMLVWDENRRPFFSMIRGFIYEHLEKENQKDHFVDTELEEDNIKVDLLNDI